jgi:hypothetical protein
MTAFKSLSLRRVVRFDEPAHQLIASLTGPFPGLKPLAQLRGAARTTLGFEFR